ncbi:hypothetical protein [Klebsiella pneumoniae]|uniref:hypothetical protein n=1 Tax=Klebsiella pneumoniae TaxID=573 RepID=UPI00132FAFD5|nr:hypothetical protein [Klebsiella pneumoniae]
MGTYIRTCAEVKTADGWQPVSYGVFPPVPWHDMDGYEKPAYSEPFRYQDYGMFGLFAGERNDSQCQVLAAPRGFPQDISEEALLFLVPEITQMETFCGYSQSELPQPDDVGERIALARPDTYGYSWLSAAELTAFDYDQTFTDQRPDTPRTVTYREYLGERYFLHLDTLKSVSAQDEVRVLFCFI